MSSLKTFLRNIHLWPHSRVGESSLPEFPNFKPLELSDKEAVEKITSKYPPYSDFNFVSMWSWDTKGQMRISSLNGNLVVKFTDYITGESFCSFLGDNNVNDTVDKLCQLSQDEKLKSEFKLIPEIATKGLNLKFETIEDRNNFDYVYDVEKLAAYQGKEFETKRNLVNRFERECPDAVVRVCDLNDQKTIKDILAVGELWEQDKSKYPDRTTAKNEALALKRMLTMPKSCAFIATGIYVNNQLVSFCVNELLSSGWAISHFAKADSKSSGAYAFLMRENAKVLKEKGVKFLNYEQDLGLPNLRFAKESFRPINFLKKGICTCKS